VKKCGGARNPLPTFGRQINPPPVPPHSTPIRPRRSHAKYFPGLWKPPTYPTNDSDRASEVQPPVAAVLPPPIVSLHFYEVFPSRHVLTFAHVSAACQVCGLQQPYYLHGLTVALMLMDPRLLKSPVIMARFQRSLEPD
jgi:hypothetical protein